MKNCTEISEYLALYAENELDSNLLLEVEEHLKNCPSCKEDLEAIKATMVLIKSLPEEELPGNFKAQLHERLILENKKKSHFGFSSFYGRTIGITASIAAVFIFALFAKGWILPTNMKSDSAPEIASYSYAPEEEMPKVVGDEEKSAKEIRGEEAAVSNNDVTAFDQGTIKSADSEKSSFQSEKNRTEEVEIDPNAVTSFSLAAADIRGSTLSQKELTMEFKNQEQNIKQIKEKITALGGVIMEETAPSDKVETNHEQSKTIENTALSMKVMMINSQMDFLMIFLEEVVVKESMISKELETIPETEIEMRLKVRAGELDKQLQEIENNSDSVSQIDSVNAQKALVDKSLEELKKEGEYTILYLNFVKK